MACSCHRKSNEDAVKERRRVSGLFNMMEPSLLQFYISRQWLNKFKTFAEPGPISNDDFLCSHGGTYDHSCFLTETSQRSKWSLSRNPPPCPVSKQLVETLCFALSQHSMCFHLGRGFLTLTKTAEYSLHNIADFKRGFYFALCR